MFDYLVNGIKQSVSTLIIGVSSNKFLVDNYDTNIDIPDFISGYVVLIILTCLFLSMLMIMIETIGTMMKYVIKKVIITQIPESDESYYIKHDINRSERQQTESIHYITPDILLHELIDRTCPILSHTPCELPNTSSNRILPIRLRSPCSLCKNGIAMGQLIRRLPCNHTFHARCIDSICLSHLQQKNLGHRSKLTFQCPKCHLKLFPTPDLIADDIIIA